MIEEQDALQSDQLQFDPLKHGDPLSPAYNKEVDNYYSDLGAPMSQGQYKASQDFKGEVDKTVEKQKGLLGQYRNDYNKALTEADDQLSGILSEASAKNAQAVSSIPQIRPVSFSVWSDGWGSLEQTYTIDKSMADKIMAEANKQTPGIVAYDPKRGYMINSKGYGKELHEALIDAQAKTVEYGQIYEKQRSAVQTAGDMQIGAAEEAAAIQRKSMTDQNAETERQFSASIADTESKWTTYVSDLQTAFQKGQQTNTGGIKQLVESGALTVTGRLA